MLLDVVAEETSVDCRRRRSRIRFHGFRFTNNQYKLIQLYRFPNIPFLLISTSTSTSLLVFTKKSSKIRATSTTVPLQTYPKKSASRNDSFSCPICFEPLTRKGPPGLNLPAIYRSAFKCQKCNKSYSSKDIYLDLTITYGRTHLFHSCTKEGGVKIFNRSGFPGPDEEYFKPAEGGLLWMSAVGVVIALDFSETMLRQCYDLIIKDETILNPYLPFSSGSVDAVHAGAALHCWPSPSNAVAEISRVLLSGGVFVGTTFLNFSFGNLTYNNLTEEEIEDLCTSCGLVNYTCSTAILHHVLCAEALKCEG
ncbi:hypothetical protein MKW92_051799 [Papaver armeniacum]|nr:hypothetical protein MKW92_051799 [Papaver armeniacum]